VPDAIARQIHADQLLTMMLCAFVFNRNPPMSSAVDVAMGGSGKSRASGVGLAGASGAPAATTAATRDVALATSAAASITRSFEGTRPVSSRQDVRRRRSGGAVRSNSRQEGEASVPIPADGYTDTMFKVSFSELDRLLSFPVELFLQMAVEPRRSLDPCEAEVAKVVLGRERKGFSSAKVQPFKGFFPDEAAMRKVRHAVLDVVILWVRTRTKSHTCRQPPDSTPPAHACARARLLFSLPSY
jgi:hypothetical protein